MADILCDSCLYLYYDEEFDEWFCGMQDGLDEDDIARRFGAPHRVAETCPYYCGGDEYTIVRKQN